MVNRPRTIHETIYPIFLYSVIFLNRMLFAPEGFAHGFLVLSETAEFQYKCSDYYAPEDERGIAWNDPTIAIDWPLDGIEPVLSERDRRWAALAETEPTELPELEP